MLFGVELVPWPGEPDSMVVALETGDRVHFLDWRPALAVADAPGLPLLLVHGWHLASH
jgi:hypothetical protein